MTTDLIPFKLITRDQAWIKRHDGHHDGRGHVTVMLPADQVEEIRFAGHDWLRHTFAAGGPKDVGAVVMCPVRWL
jgi:hypothetical protein